MPNPTESTDPTKIPDQMDQLARDRREREKEAAARQTVEPTAPAKTETEVVKRPAK